MRLHRWQFGRFGLILLALSFVSSSSRCVDGAVIGLFPSADNSLYFESPANSNGAGNALFAGNNNNSHARRALLAFDIAGNIPAGATITSAELRLSLLQAPPNLSETAMTLHPLTASWGEGTSNAGNPGGMGILAAARDATWVNRFHPGTAWTDPGGDFNPLASASAPVGVLGNAVWTGLAGDVQNWLNGPAGNFGWLLLGDETTNQTARSFASRQHITAALRPRLTIEYTAVPEPGMWACGAGGLALCGLRRARKK